MVIIINGHGLYVIIWFFELFTAINGLSRMDKWSCILLCVITFTQSCIEYFCIVGESVMCMCCDEAGDYLITGDTQGYVKVWDISEYCIANRPTGLCSYTLHMYDMTWSFISISIFRRSAGSAQLNAHVYLGYPIWHMLHVQEIYGTCIRTSIYIYMLLVSTYTTGSSAMERRQEKATKFFYTRLDAPARLASGSQKERYEKHFAIPAPESQPHLTHKIPPILNSFRGILSSAVYSVNLPNWSVGWHNSMANQLLFYYSAAFQSLVFDWPSTMLDWEL